MALDYYVFGAEITVDSTNYTVAYTDSGGDRTTTIPVGTYYLLDGLTTGCILRAIELAIDTDSADTYTAACTYNVAASSLSATISITSSSSAFRLRWNIGTFPPSLIGWALSTTATGATQTAPNSPRATWVPTESAATDSFRRLSHVSSTRSRDGTEYAVQHGTHRRDRLLGFEWIDGSRMWATTTDEYASFERWSEYALGRNVRIYLYDGTEAVTNADNIDGDGSASTYRLAAASLAPFGLPRSQAGLDLYPLEIEMLRRS